MNIKDLAPGSYTPVVAPKMNIRDLNPSDYSVVQPEAPAQVAPEQVGSGDFLKWKSNLLAEGWKGAAGQAAVSPIKATVNLATMPLRVAKDVAYDIPKEAYGLVKEQGIKAPLYAAQGVGQTALDAAKPIYNAASGLGNVLLGTLQAGLKKATGVDLGNKEAEAALTTLGEHLLNNKLADVTNVVAKVKQLVEENPEQVLLFSTQAPKVTSNVARSTKIPQTIENVRSTRGLDKSIEATMPLANKEVRIDALRDALPESKKGLGGVKRQGPFGKSVIQQAPEDIARGTVANEYIRGVKDPVKQIQNLNRGIIDTSSKVDDFLNKNPIQANIEDMRGYIELKNKPSSNITSDATSFEAYSRANENAINTLYDTMKKSAKESGNFESTSVADIRKARIAIDKQITRELGEEVFGTPQYKGIRAAEIDVRNTMNRMSEDLLRYPNQLEGVNRLNDFISTSRARGIDIDVANPQVMAELEKGFGLKKTAQSEANAQKLAAEHDRMTKIYESRDNIIDNYQKNIGKNKVEEAVQKSKVMKGALDTVKRTLPFGIGSNL